MIETCRTSAARAKKAVRCTIEVRAEAGEDGVPSLGISGSENEPPTPQSGKVIELRLGLLLAVSTARSE